MPKLFDMRMRDGSRLFATLPQTASWYELRDHIARLPGASVTGFVTDGITEAWIDVAFRGQALSVNDQSGEYWLFAEDPACPEDVLLAFAQHCAALLGED